MKKQLKALLLTALLAATPLSMVTAAGGVHYPKAPVDVRDQASLQRGAQIFMNYCLSCHSANNIRYNRLKDIGLTEEQIRNNLIFTEAKIGETMHAVMQRDDAKAWFGVAPPDLTLMARSRGADYLYAYLRGFYQDPTRPMGWNNTVFDKAGMPHVLWEQQGIRTVELDEKGMPIMEPDEHGNLVPKLKWVRGGLHTILHDDGTADTSEFDNTYARDLVNYMVWMGEPSQNKRKQIGYVVLLFLMGVLLPLAYFLNKEYWKDVEH